MGDWGKNELGGRSVSASVLLAASLPHERPKARVGASDLQAFLGRFRGRAASSALPSPRSNSGCGPLACGGAPCRLTVLRARASVGQAS
jgi:hypothetical protein